MGRPAFSSWYLALETPDFSAQVIAAWDPAYRDRVFVVVDQDPESHKTHVLACSRAARERGIEAGMPLTAVRRRLRDVEAVFRNRTWEASVRDELEAACWTFTPAFHLLGGGGILDVTGTPVLRAMSIEAAAEKLAREAAFRTGLSEVSVGAAATRLMAKVMAKQALGKNRAVAVCAAGEEAATLGPLGPECLPGLSPRCRERIRRYALTSVERIRALGRQALTARFGGEGDKLYTLACGLDLEETPARKRGISAETSLAGDVNDEDELARKVRLTADKLVFALRQAGQIAGKLVVALRYADNKAVRKTCKVAPATRDFQPLAALAQSAFQALYARRVALRSISLSVPVPGEDTGQSELFDSAAERKQRALGDAMTKIRMRSGFGAIGSGSGGI